MRMLRSACHTLDVPSEAKDQWLLKVASEYWSDYVDAQDELCLCYVHV